MDAEISESIGSLVLSAYRKSVNTYMSKHNGQRLHTWHVSDFTSPCIRKTYYQRLYPEKYDAKKNSIFFLGNIIHEHTPLSKINELTMCYDIETDQPVSIDEVLLMPRNSLKTIITGTLDDLLQYGNDFIIADKKTFNGSSGYKKTSPDSQYSLQLSIYRVLLQKNYGIDAKYGCLLYLDKSNDLAESPIPFELLPIEDTKVIMKEILVELCSDKLPKPNVCWMCNGNNRKGAIYCPYVELCKQDGGR